MENENLVQIDAMVSRSIHIRFDGKILSAGELLAESEAAGAHSSDPVRGLIGLLNPGFDFGAAAAEEWTRRLRLIVSGRDKALMNPYSDLALHSVEPVTRSSKHLVDTPLIRRLPAFPARPESGSSEEILRKTLFILAVGGADTTFYDGMEPGEIKAFLGGVVPPDLYRLLDPSEIGHGIPRAFASKNAGKRAVTIVESLIVQAYAAGVRHAAVLSNALTAPAIAKYLEPRLSGLKGLKWKVTVQPLFPSIVEDSDNGNWTVAPEYGGHPAGHGHGFKHTLNDDTVKQWVRQDGLDGFLFCNGDNAALFGGGAEHFAGTLGKLRELKREGKGGGPRTAFYLVWEKFQKGGFAFLLRNGKTGEEFPQIFEAELASECGVDLESLKNEFGGYNTNVAVGLLEDAYRNLERLPLALKRKKILGLDRLIFEASFATALTTFQDADGVSHFEPGSSMVVLPPDRAEYPHWIHVSLRKRADWLAFLSSAFKVRSIRTEAGTFDAAVPDRSAASPLPSLEGNVLSLNSGEFFEVFRHATLDVDGFIGTLVVDIGKGGRIRFEGNVRFTGDGTIRISAPEGETRIVKDQEFISSRS